MAARKRRNDINLFKAAGGERAKSRQIPITKKLLYVMVLVVFLVGAAIGGLVYLNSARNAELKKLKQAADNYEFTERVNAKLTEQLAQLNSEIEAITAIEFMRQTKPDFFTDLSVEELTALRTYLFAEESSYKPVTDFVEVVDYVLMQLALQQYSLGTDYDNELYNLRFFYSALSFMRDTAEVNVALPLQDPDYDNSYWYCYYRGKMVILAEGKGTDAPQADATMADLLNSNNWGMAVSPFSSLAVDAGSLDTDIEFTYRYTTVVVEDTYYSMFAINTKSIVERFTDVVEGSIRALPDPESYSYKLGSILFDYEASTFSLTFGLNETEEFLVKDICHAVGASPFFDTEDSFAYPTTSLGGEAEVELRFLVVNEASKAVKDNAANFFGGQQQQEE